MKKGSSIRDSALGVLEVLVACLGRHSPIRRSWPRVKGVLTVPGLIASVQVIRDSYGVPHIYAQNLRDLFFAQGYVHAQDRLWQMDFQRRIGHGRLSEIFGKGTLEIDRIQRILGIGRSAQQDLGAVNEETARALESYARGVNAFIHTHQNRLPFEYVLLRARPDPWCPLDTLVWGKMLQWDLSNDWFKILFRQQLIDCVGAERAADLIPDYSGGYLFGGTPLSNNLACAHVDPNPDSALGTVVESSMAEGLGTNAWVVGASRSASGKPLLANDTHLSFGMPGTWYEIGLHCPGYQCVGMSLPGTIGVIIGHNERIAWGMATSRARVQDIYLEQVHPGNPYEYRVGDHYEPFQVIQEDIRIRGQPEPVKVEVLISRHGPIINDLDERSRQFSQPMALKWMPASRPSTLINAVLDLNRAQNWDDFTRALRAWDSPMQTVLYADVDDNIGSYCVGAVPLRACGPTATPIPGWDNEHEWIGTIPFEKLPHQFNPASDIIISANSRPVDEKYPYYLAPEWCTFTRERRIAALLNARERLTCDDLAEIQGDVFSSVAQRFVPLLLAVQTEQKEVREAQEFLARWDFQMRATSVAAGIYEVALRSLVQILVEPLLGDMLTAMYLKREQQYTGFIESLLDNPESSWWRVPGHPELQTRAQVMRAALERAVDWWSEQHGKDVSGWRWGKVHTVTFHHPVYSRIPLLRRSGNADLGPVDGDAQTVLATGFFDSLVASSGPVHRHVTDLAHWENSRSVLIGGQSGHLFHPHYKDQVELWKAVRYHAQHWERQAIEADSHGAILELRPAPGWGTEGTVLQPLLPDR